MSDHDHGNSLLPADDSPPRNNVILIAGIASLCCLVGLKFVFDSYLEGQRANVRTAQLETSVTSETLAAHREAVRERLEASEVPIQQAMARLTEEGRRGFPQLSAVQSTDEGARLGWNRRAPEAAPVVPEPEN
jgi:hypothetical protein